MKIAPFSVLIFSITVAMSVISKSVTGQSGNSSTATSHSKESNSKVHYEGSISKPAEPQTGFSPNSSEDDDKVPAVENINGVAGPTENQCMYSVELTDSFGDGWNDNVLGFRQGGTIVGTFGEYFTNGFSYGPVYVALNHNVLTEIVVVNIGEYTSEVGFVVKDPYGAIVYSRNPGINFTLYTIFSTFTSNCTPPPCMKPTLLDPTSITATSVTLNWSAPSNPPSIGYQFEVRTSGTGGSGNSGLVISGSTDAGITSITVTGLIASTTYYLYIRSVCDDNTFSEWNGPKTFNTSCGTLSMLSEGFENLFPPVCWILTNSGSGHNWSRSDNPFNGLYSLTYSYDSLYQANAWAFTGAFSMIAGRTYVISFFQSVGDSAYPEKLKVTVGNSATAAAQTRVLWNNGGESQLYNTDWIERRIEFISSSTGTYYFGFNCYSDIDMFELYVDNISILEKPQIDLSLSDFYQSSASLEPEDGLSQNSFSVINQKSTSSLSLPSEHVVNSPLIPDGSKNGIPRNTQQTLRYPSIPIELDVVVTNLGVQSSCGALNWNISGTSQDPLNFSSIAAGDSQILTLDFSPTDRGTFLTTCSVAATGDANPYNDNQSIRTRAYPDLFTRTTYDRGDNMVDSWVGYNNATIRTKTGVRFTADKAIKLAGVDYICRTEQVTSGSFNIQVRSAGSSTVTPGTVLYCKSFNTSDYLPNGNNGDYIFFPFDDNSPVISSGSDYWITIKAPAGVLNPGAAHSSGFTAGRSFYEANGDTTLWYPLVIDTEKAWLMRSIAVTPAIQAKSLTLKAYLEGLWNGVSLNKVKESNLQGDTWDKFEGTTADTLSILLADNNAPHQIAYALHGIALNTDGTIMLSIPPEYNGSYYIVIKHRQSVETWSSDPVSFSGFAINYDFTISASQAYGNNEKSLGAVWAIYTGDVSQNGYVELNDVNAVFNSVRASGYGYILFDINGNGFAEVDDLNKTYSNQRLSAGKMFPSN